MQTYSTTDVYDQKVEGFIDPKIVKELSRIQSWRGLAQIALEWLAIALAISICAHHWSPLLYILTVVWVGARQNGLAVMMHEAVHYRLLPDRAWNEWVGEVFTCWPLLITLNGYRQVHFTHHRYLNTSQDPDYERKRGDVPKYFPTNMKQMLVTTLKYLVGYYAIIELLDINKETKIPDKVKNLRRLFYAVVLISSVIFHFWKGLLIYWIVPLCTYFLWEVYLRTITDHGVEGRDDILQKTRHIDANLFERLMFCPNFIQVHGVHHIYPSIPFYNLTKMHRLLMENPEYAKRATISGSFVSLVIASIKDNKNYFQP